MLELFKDEFSSCIFSILAEPTAIDVDYYFYRIEQLTNALREYVSKCQSAHNSDCYEC